MVSEVSQHLHSWGKKNSGPYNILAVYEPAKEKGSLALSSRKDPLTLQDSEKTIPDPMPKQ